MEVSIWSEKGHEVLVDTIFCHGRVWTGEADQPWTDRLAVGAGRVLAVGRDAEDVGSRRVVDLGGLTVVPGFHDAHAHSVSAGLAMEELDLRSPPMECVEDIYEAVVERAATADPGGWVVGSRYDHTRLGGAHPTVAGLDRAVGDRPVWLKHVSGHMSVVNSVVLHRLRHRFEAAEEGGYVERDASGAPTGLLVERAQLLVRELVCPYSVSNLTSALARVHKQYLTEGITSVCDAGIGAGLVGHSGVELAAYQSVREAGELEVRTTVMVAWDALHSVRAHESDGIDVGLDLGLRTGFGDSRLRIGPVKLFADGSVRGRTCYMHEQFADAPGERGLLQMDSKELRRAIMDCHRSGWQVATHAIGDAAVDLVVDAYSEALERYPRKDHRHRIEHCGITSEETVAQLARLGVIPVPQPEFVSDFGDEMIAALGTERSDRAYRLRSFLDAGVVVPGSSDRPVTTGAPLKGIHAMVNRRTALGREFSAKEALTANEAIRAYTWGSAYASFSENVLGSLRPGKLADFVVLSDDPSGVEADGLESISVLATVIDGRLVYDALGLG
jgi:predicted amidohydrolase YtcJ